MLCSKCNASIMYKCMYEINLNIDKKVITKVKYRLHILLTFMIIYNSYSKPIWSNHTLYNTTRL